jgi:hypothetical protein
MSDPSLVLPTHFDILDANHGAYLGQIIDTSVLVNRSVLRQRGVEPNDVYVEYDPSWQGISTQYPNTIVLGPQGLAFVERNREYAYVVLAHELTHLTQGQRDYKMFKTGHGTRTKFHSRDAREQEAEFWESQQAARFGWDREDYTTFVTQLHGILGPIPEQYRKYVETEKKEREYTMLPVMSRRPRTSAPTQSPGVSPDVHVHEHRRRA